MTTLLPESSGNGRTAHTHPHDSDRPGLGALLRRAREGRGLTLEQISNETRIPRRHLAALEHDNLAVVPGGFYRQGRDTRLRSGRQPRSESCINQGFDRAEAGVPETPGSREQAPSRKRVLIVIGVVVAAAVFGRAMVGREPAIHGDAQPRRTTDSPDSRIPPNREMPPDAIVETPQRTPMGQVTPASALSGGAPVVAMEPTGTRATTASKGDLAFTTDPAAARASPGYGHRTRRDNGTRGSASDGEWDRMGCRPG